MKPLHFIRVAAAATMLLAPAGMASRALAQAAPPPDALAAANELFAMQSKDMVNQIARTLMGQIWPLVERDLQSKVDKATLVELRQEFERIQLESIGDLMKDGPPIYARHFTAAELRELVAFYRTPTGQKMQRELPQVMAEFVQGMAPRMAGIQTTTQERFRKILQDRGYAK